MMAAPPAETSEFHPQCRRSTLYHFRLERPGIDMSL